MSSPVSPMASERAAALADEFAAANEDAVAFSRTCSKEDWSVVVPGEEWTVGVVLHHVAEAHAQGLRWISSMACGDGVPATAEEIDRVNAAHAARASEATPGETVALLEEEGARLEAALRGLTDAELDRPAPFGPAGGRVFPTADLAAVMARHVREQPMARISRRGGRREFRRPGPLAARQGRQCGHRAPSRPTRPGACSAGRQGTQCHSPT